MNRIDRWCLRTASRKAASILLAALVLLLSLTGTTAMAAPEHGQGGEPAAADPCADLSQPASLRCALTPSAVFAPNGRLWLVWAHSGHVYLNHSDDKGKTFSAPRAVNTVPERVVAHGENRPKIALGPAGQIYVSWTQSLSKRFTGQIRFARSLDGGNTFSAPVIVNDDRAEISHRFEALIVDAKGNVMLAWLDKRDQERAQRRGEPYLGAALYYTWSDDQGKTFKQNRKLHDNSCECCRVVVALDTNGQPVLLWRHVFGNNIRDHALLGFLSPGKPGELVRASVDEWRIDACPHHGPSLAIDSDGIYHMTWFTAGAQRSGLFYAYSKDQGRTHSEPMALGGKEGGAGHAHVLAQGRNVHIVWQEFDGTHSRIMLSTSTDSGRSWASSRELAASTGDVDYPFLVADGAVVYLSWNTRAQGFLLLPIKPIDSAGATR